MRADHPARRAAPAPTRVTAAVDPLERRRLFAALSVVAPLPALSYTFVNTEPTGLVVDAAGDLFGIDPQGGATDVGTVFEVPAGTTTLNVIHTFDGTAGAAPTALTIDGSGNLFGLLSYSTATAPATVNTAGASASGPAEIFEIPAANRAAISIPYTFPTPTTDGEFPSTVAADAAGNIDVLTSSISDGGTIVQLAPATGYATPTVIGTLPAADARAYPDTLAFAPDGSIYGLTGGGGDAAGDGTIFHLPAGSTTAATVATFDKSTTGSEPVGLYVDPSGNVFGTAETGSGDANSYGDVWEYAAATGTLMSVAGFHDVTAADGTVTSPDGIYPLGGVVPDGSGNLIGTTSQGTDGGIAFSADPTTGTITTLASFETGTTGTAPETGLVADGSGHYFGVTSGGGANGRGAVFSLTLAGGSTTPTPTPTPTSTTTALTPTVASSTLATAVISGTKAKPGKVVVTVTNSTTTTESGTAKVALYATATGAVDAASTLLGFATKKLKLAAGKSATFAVAVKSLQLPAGTYTVLAQSTDPAGTVTTAAAGPTVTVAAPFVDLTAVVGAVTPTALTAGKPITVTVTLTNTGNTNVAGAGSVTLALSSDGTTVSVPFTPVKHAITVKAGGHALSVKLKVKTPTTVPAGTYVVLASVVQGANTATAVGTTPVTFG